MLGQEQGISPPFSAIASSGRPEQLPRKPDRRRTLIQVAEWRDRLDLTTLKPEIAQQLTELESGSLVWINTTRKSMSATYVVAKHGHLPPTVREGIESGEIPLVNAGLIVGFSGTFARQNGITTIEPRLIDVPRKIATGVYRVVAQETHTAPIDFSAHLYQISEQVTLIHLERIWPKKTTIAPTHKYLALS